MTRWLLLTIAVLLALQVASTWGDEPELLIDATPAQYVDNCGRIHNGQPLLEGPALRQPRNELVRSEDGGVA